MNPNPSHQVLAAPEASAPVPGSPAYSHPVSASSRWWTAARLTSVVCFAACGLVVYGTIGTYFYAQELTRVCLDVPTDYLCWTGIADRQLVEVATRLPSTLITATVAAIVPACLIERCPRLAATLACLGAGASVILAATTIVTILLVNSGL